MKFNILNKKQLAAASFALTALGLGYSIVTTEMVGQSAGTRMLEVTRSDSSIVQADPSIGEISGGVVCVQCILTDTPEYREDVGEQVAQDTIELSEQGQPASMALGEEQSEASELGSTHNFSSFPALEKDQSDAMTRFRERQSASISSATRLTGQISLVAHTQIANVTFYCYDDASCSQLRSIYDKANSLGHWVTLERLPSTETFDWPRTTELRFFVPEGEPLALDVAQQLGIDPANVQPVPNTATPPQNHHFFEVWASLK